MHSLRFSPIQLLLQGKCFIFSAPAKFIPLEGDPQKSVPCNADVDFRNVVGVSVFSQILRKFHFI